MTNPHSHSAHSFTSEKFISWLGRFASVIAILMYISYIAQIINNLHGQYGSPVQPFVAGINLRCGASMRTLKKIETGRFFGPTSLESSSALQHA